MSTDSSPKQMDETVPNTAQSSPMAIMKKELPAPSSLIISEDSATDYRFLVKKHMTSPIESGRKVICLCEGHCIAFMLF